MDRLVQQLSAEFLPAGDVSTDAPGSRRSPGLYSPERSPELRRRRIVLACAQCGGRNYRKTKARREGATPLSLSKFCSLCNAHTQHREAV
ncbi:MAG: 50S ribosomal protein L33 [Deltaproteobacteria bacterium]